MDGFSTAIGEMISNFDPQKCANYFTAARFKDIHDLSFGNKHARIFR
jgi:hypothetical protein